MQLVSKFVSDIFSRHSYDKESRKCKVSETTSSSWPATFIFSVCQPVMYQCGKTAGTSKDAIVCDWQLLSARLVVNALFIGL